MLVELYDVPFNCVAFAVSGDYRVDWGDGNVENYNAGEKAEHNYTYDGDDTVMITVTPQSGQSITDIDLDQKHQLITLSNSNYTQPITAISGNTPNLTNLKISAGFPNNANFKKLEYFRWGENTLSNINGLFWQCTSLSKIPHFNINNVTTMNATFYYCTALKEISLINTNNVTDMHSSFEGCYSLDKISEINTSNVTDMSMTFRECYSLEEIPSIDTSNVTDMQYMFTHCRSLKKIPLIDMSKVENSDHMFNGCFSLSNVPNLDLSNTRYLKNMFNSCSSLKKLTLSSFYENAEMNYIFYSCYNLQRLIAPIKSSFSIENANLNAEALNEMFEALPDVTDKTVTITGNPGANDCDTTIATNKGWTVQN